MAFPPAQSQIEGKDPIWLLDLDLGGDVRRYASRPIELTDANSDTWHYQGGLIVGTVTYGEVINRVGVTIEDEEEDWAQYVARGGQLSMRTGYLRLWWEGLTLEQAWLIMAGKTANLSISPPGAPGHLRGALRGDLLDNAQLWPPIQAVIDEDTFTHTLGSIEIDNAARGVAYPIVVGYPGTGDDAEDSASPSGVYNAPLAQISGSYTTTRPIIALGEVHATTVHLWDVQSDQGSTGGTPSLRRHSDCTVQTATDALGRTYSYAELPSTPSDTDVDLAAASSHRLMASFRNNSSYGGGILNRARDAPLRGLGEVIRYCLEVSGVQVDVGRQESERAHLDQFKIDGLIAGSHKGRVDLAKWINDELPELFPILRMRSGDGVWFRFYNLAASSRDARQRLDADTGEIARVSGIDREEGLYNRFVIQYATSDVGSARRRILAPDPEVIEPYLGVDTRVISSPLCKRSEQLYGLSEAPTLNPDFIWSGATAIGILEYQALKQALPVERVTVEGPHLEHLEPGDVVLINDTSLQWTDRVALIESMVIGQTPVRLRLRLIPPTEVLTS